jgi:diguanylate cyclase (GGDEF)-like protein
MSDDFNEPTHLAGKPVGSDRHADAMQAELLRLRRDLDQVQQEFNETHAAQLLQANEQLVLAVLQAEKVAETALSQLSELAHVTQRDALTDTPNRALMLDRLHNAIAIAKRHEARVAVLFVDIDHFKHINDTYGHAVGDEVLQFVARGLESAVRDSDTVSRHSGDEFLVLLAEITQASDAALIAAKMLATVATPNGIGNQPLSLSMSIGIAIYPDDGKDAAELIARADAAMYRAKKRGRGSFQFYSAEDCSEDTKVLPAAGGTHAHAQNDPEPGSGHANDLRNANEQLLLSALAAQALEARATQDHQRHVKYLAMVAHELRNPLAPIRTAAELLSRARGDEKQHAHLQEIIKRQVAHMTRILDDLLDGSRAGNGKFYLELNLVDLTDILAQTIDSCRLAITAKPQLLETHLPDRPLPIRGDPVRLAQIFRNLLDNASKYTPRGGSISLTTLVVHDTIVTTVADNGTGISAEALPHVFDLFTQEARSVASSNGGLGIGLAVVRELVEAHGGSVVASSAGPDLGSEFCVALPLATQGISVD